MKFRNPANGHVEEKSVPALWTLLFGAFYFLISGIWIHAIVMFLISVGLYAAMGAPATILVFVMNVIYCALAGSIVESYYLRKGWEKVRDAGSVENASAKPDTKKCPFCAETVKYEAVKCKHCGSDLSAAQESNSAPDQPLGKQELMDKLGITFDGEKYTFLEFKYDKFDDAVRYARNNQVEKQPCKYCKANIPAAAIKCPECGLFA